MEQNNELLLKSIRSLFKRMDNFVTLETVATGELQDIELSLNVFEVCSLWEILLTIFFKLERFAIVSDLTCWQVESHHLRMPLSMNKMYYSLRCEKFRPNLIKVLLLVLYSSVDTC
jgi:hypothetical protein